MKHSIHFKIQSAVRKLPVVAAFFICCFYVGTVITEFTKDTTTIFKLASGMTAVLSGLCFAMASNLENNKSEKRKISYAAERFLHASLAFLIGTILKYAALKLQMADWGTLTQWVMSFLGSTFNAFALALFTWGVFDSHTGINITNNILWKRLYDEKDWNNL